MAPSSTRVPIPMAQTPSAPSSPSVHVRLERLERENRRFRLAACGLALGALAWVSCGLGPEKQTVSAERFVLLGPDGSERVVLEADEAGNSFLLMRNGQASAVLSTEGPSLLLRGADGKTSGYLGIDAKNSSRLELTSQRVLDGIRLAAHAEGSAGIYVLDAQGRQRAGLEALSNGAAGVDLRDDQGRLRGSLGLDPGNLAHCMLLDERGGRRLGMLLEADGRPLLELADDLGRPRIEVSTGFDGTPLLEIKREDGGAVFRAP